MPHTNKNPFGIRADQRVALVIDGPSFYVQTRSLGWEVDYRKLHDHFEAHSILHRAVYCAVLPDDGFGDDAPHSPVRPLYDWLVYNGYVGVRKSQKFIHEADGMRPKRTSLAVEIATQMFEQAQFAENIVLFSSDPDLVAAIEATQRRGSRVTLVGVHHPKEGLHTEDALRRVVDKFVQLRDLKEVIFKRDFPGRNDAAPGFGAASSFDADAHGEVEGVADLLGPDNPLTGGGGAVVLERTGSVTSVQEHRRRPHYTGGRN